MERRYTVNIQPSRRLRLSNIQMDDSIASFIFIVYLPIILKKYLFFV